MELHLLAVFGLFFIAVGWLFQYNAMGGKKKAQEIRKETIVLGAAGIALLVIDAYLAGNWDIAVMNVGTLAASLLVLTRIKA